MRVRERSLWCLNHSKELLHKGFQGTITLLLPQHYDRNIPKGYGNPLGQRMDKFQVACESLHFRVASLLLNASLTLLASVENFNLFPQMTTKVSIKSDSFFISSNLYSPQKHYCPCGLCFMIAFTKSVKR